MVARPGHLLLADHRVARLPAAPKEALLVVVILPRMLQSSSSAWTPMPMARSTKRNLPS
jgi:hypothetical protein